MWDTHDGTRRVIPIKNEDGTRRISKDFDALFSWMYEDSYVYGTANHGRIVRVEVQTGKTEYIGSTFDEHLYVHDGESPDYELMETYANGKVYQLVYNINSQENPYIRVVDIRSGDEIRTYEINEINEIVNDGLSVSGFAVNPT